MNLTPMFIPQFSNDNQDSHLYQDLIAHLTPDAMTGVWKVWKQRTKSSVERDPWRTENWPFEKPSRSIQFLIVSSTIAVLHRLSHCVWCLLILTSILNTCFFKGKEKLRGNWSLTRTCLAKALCHLKHCCLSLFPFKLPSTVYVDWEETTTVKTTTTKSVSKVPVTVGGTKYGVYQNTARNSFSYCNNPRLRWKCELTLFFSICFEIKRLNNKWMVLQM